MIRRTKPGRRKPPAVRCEHLVADEETGRKKRCPEAADYKHPSAAGLQLCTGCRDALLVQSRFDKSFAERQLVILHTMRKLKKTIVR